MAKTQTKIIRWLARRIGYDIQRLQRTRLYPFDDGSGRGRGDGLDAFEPILPRPIDHFDILFRSCVKAGMDSPTRRRFFDAPRWELTRTCLASLVESASLAAEACPDTRITLTVFDDHSDPEPLEGIAAELAKAGPGLETRLVNLETRGNGPSLLSVYEYARAACKDVLYFVEDDYLHSPPAVTELIRSFGLLSSVLGGDVALSPWDNPEDYRHIRPTQLFLGSDRHWRRTWTTTFTSVSTVGHLNAYWENYAGLGGYGIDPEISEHNTINLIYDEVPCLSSVPSLSAHMQMIEHVSPYVDWQDWWKRHSSWPLAPLRKNA